MLDSFRLDEAGMFMEADSLAFQATPVGGYRLFSAFGDLGNRFQARFQGLSFSSEGGPQMGGAAPVDPDDVITEMRLGADRIWFGLRTNATQTEIASVAEECEYIARAMQVSDVSRFGFRAGLVWRQPDEDALKRRLLPFLGGHGTEWTRLGKVVEGQIGVNLEAEGLGVTLAIQPVQRVSTRFEGRRQVGPTEATYWLKIDADIFEVARRNVGDAKGFLRRAGGYVVDALIPFMRSELSRGE